MLSLPRRKGTALLKVEHSPPCGAQFLTLRETVFLIGRESQGMCEQTVTKQKHPSPCFPRELCPGQEEAARPPCPDPRRRHGQGRAAPRPGGHRSAPHRAEVTRCTLPAGGALHRAPGETNTRYPCCSALRIEAQLAARAAHLPAPAAPRSAPRPSSATRGWGGTTEPGRSGRGRAPSAGPDRASAGYPASAPGAPDSGRYCSFCNWHRQPATT